MRILPSGGATTPIRLAYPAGWNIAALTDLTLVIRDDLGATLLAEEELTLPDPIAIDAGVSRYASSITIDPDDGPLVVGDMIRLVGAAGGDVVTVSGYDAVSGVAGIDRVVNHAYAEGDLLYLCAVTASIDLSDTITFIPGATLTLIWTPTGTGAPFTELARLERYMQIDVAAFAEELRALFPRAYDALTSPEDRLPIVLRAAQERLRLQLLARECDIARVRDSAILAPSLRLLCASAWTSNGDDALKYERGLIAQEYAAAFEELVSLPIWADSDDDLVTDSDEVGDYPKYFERAW